jgi:Fe-Mn family superoxide dismutase
MQKDGGGPPQGPVAAKISEAFGSYENFRKEFAKAAATVFGSGWAWLVLENGKLKITQTSNADTPAAHGQKAVLTIDVWEHAYYLDYQNQRVDYIQAFLDHLLNWDFVAQNLE